MSTLRQAGFSKHFCTIFGNSMRCRVTGARRYSTARKGGDVLPPACQRIGLVIRRTVSIVISLISSTPLLTIIKITDRPCMLHTLVADKLHYNFNLTARLSTNCNLGAHPLSIEIKVENVTHVTYEFKASIRLTLVFPDATKS